jgi:hypothetical protein
MSSTGGTTGTARGGWPARFRRRAPALCLALLLWPAAEILAVLLLPVAVPRPVALSWYLGAEARQVTREFLDGRHPYLVYDPVTGWRNRAGCDRGLWRIDSIGSRSTHPLDWRPRRPRRLLFLGNSLVNGDLLVPVEQTIPGLCEDPLTEAGDFATMLYSLDQSVLDYETRLHRFGAGVVVVGLSLPPGNALTCRYVPFLQRSQVRMPYFKPRFVVAGDSLRLVPVPSPGEWRAMFRSADVLDRLGRDDGHRGELESYRRFGLTPLAATLRQGARRAGNLVRLLKGDAADTALSVPLMRRLVAAAARHDARVVFLLLPVREQAFPSGWRRRLPDRCAATAAALRAQGFTVLDGRRALQDSGLPASRLYVPGGKHYTPAANRVLAGALRGMLGEGAGARR